MGEQAGVELCGALSGSVWLRLKRSRQASVLGLVSTAGINKLIIHYTLGDVESL